MTNTYYVYIMASPSGTLYVGMTNDLAWRVYKHKNKLLPGFTSQYNVNRLVLCRIYERCHCRDSARKANQRLESKQKARIDSLDQPAVERPERRMGNNIILR